MAKLGVSVDCADHCSTASRDGDVWCLPDANCTNCGCICYLFERKDKPRGQPQDDWDPIKPQSKKHPAKDGYQYGCLCLQKISA